MPKHAKDKKKKKGGARQLLDFDLVKNLKGSDDNVRGAERQVVKSIGDTRTFNPLDLIQ